MSAPDPDLLDLGLTGRDWTALEKLAAAVGEFEPLAKRTGVGAVTAERLVALSLVEKGEPSPAYKGRGYDVGYRLSERGWRALEHQRALRGGPRLAPWLGSKGG